MGLQSLPTDANLKLTDVTTNNAATTKHGFLKKLPNIATQFMNGAGNWTVPAGTGGSGGDTLSHLYVKSDYGAAGDGTTDDTTAINNAIAAVASHRGQELIFEPGVYLVPGGITETKPGLVVKGIGARSGGPGQWGDNGVVLQATTAGAWVWTHDAGSGNDYDGGRFESLTFKGDADTGGGLRIRRGFTVVMHCASCLHTTGIGFLVQLGQSGSNDSSWNICMNCFSQDDLVGFQSGTSAEDGTGATSTEWHNCVNLKTTGGGILHTGSGLIMWDNNASIIGGKMEGNSIGLQVLHASSSGGSMVIGTRFEDNATYDIALNRASGATETRNLVMTRANNILVGPFQFDDLLIVTPSSFGTITDNGTDTIIIGNGIFKSTRTSGTPSGGFSGEIRVGNSKIWVNDAGTWKSVAVA